MPIGLSGFRSWISCGGHEIACQNVELSEDGMEVTCWIASEAGKMFSVNWTRPTRLKSTVMRGEVQVDDIKCRGIIMHNTNTPGCVYTREGFTTSSKTIKPFIFSSQGEFFFSERRLVRSNGVYEGNTSSAAAPAGEIKLSIWEVAVTRQENHRTVVALPDSGAAHMVRLGPETGRPRATNNLRSRKLGSRPVATFIFKYQPGYKDTARSRKGGHPLKGQHEGSARDTPSEEGQETDEEGEDTNEEEEEAVNDEPPQQYISNLKVVYTGSSSQMPTNAIEEVQGRSNDIGKDMGGSFVWLVPEYTATKAKALTSISVEIHEKPWDGHDDLAKEARGTRYRYLHFEKNPDEPKKIDQIVLVRSESSESPHVSDEYSTLSGNINEGRGGDFLFLAWSTIPQAEKMY
ncbi:hypothetical protein HWV62_33125 [Athelia sp. TMB]|nr:hypothetical protein HWV62_33125 [Athelia sp. TMB]